MTSVERVNDYITIKGENLKFGLTPFEPWPRNGEIVFDNVSFAYDEHLPNILKNISFKISPKEKIGVVGRTGSGKSTIFQALLRVAEPSGFLMIDGINIKDLCLTDLRSKISVIPVSFPVKTCWRSEKDTLCFYFKARTDPIYGIFEIQFGSIWSVFGRCSMGMS
jgi:ABC-type multidrug transport system fused ATPase/permease subunit